MRIRKSFRQNPFQLDLFIRRIRLGFSALCRLRVGMKFKAPFVSQPVTYRFARDGRFFFKCNGFLFSATAKQAAYLEFCSC